MRTSTDRAKSEGSEGTRRAGSGPTPATEPGTGPRPTLTNRGLLRLQRSAGNRAVARLVARATPARVAVQRRADTGACAAPAPAPEPVSPHDDPRFAQVDKEIKQTGKTLKTHPAPAAEARKASDAAVPPTGDREAQAKAGQADKMGGAKPGGFDKAAFMAAVRSAIAAKAPQNLDEADKFATSGQADSVKGEVMGKVTQGKERSAQDIASKTGEAPDMSKAKDKPVTPMTEEPAPRPPVPDAAKAMPAKAPPEQTDLGAGECETDAKMAEADVDQRQLERSNEPELTAAVEAKKAGEAHSATAPAEVRATEQATLQSATQGAGQSGQAAVGAMIQGRAGTQSQVAGDKGAAKTKDEQERARITGEMRKIFDATKTDVDKILADLDGAVAQKFEAGEATAKAAFTADHQARMQRYKDLRYEGLSGAARWTADLFTGLPKEANDIFLQSRKLYEQKMDQVISDVADHIGQELGRAQSRIAKGRDEINAFVKTQPKELQKVATQAAGEMGKEFDKLVEDVESRSESLADDLATRYVEARNKVDEEIKSLQDANKGLWDKAKDAVGGAIETILKLKAMLLGVLARAAGAIDKIIKDPIGFLGNLINAVKSGVMNFATNILSHLKTGLQGWLFGKLADAGIEIPDTFDLKGIVKMVLSILGLTWTRIRTKIVAKIGETAMNAVEKGVEIFQILINEGVGGLWRFLLDKLSSLKDTVMNAIQDFVVVKIVKAGITWLISALNPAAAFIKACKMIYDVVMFFVEKGSQIKEFVDSVLDSIESIASGGVGAVAGLIERTLAKIIPLLLGFLASLLGLGGVSEKIKEILEKVQKPVGEVVDAVINGALKLAAPIINLAKRGAAWAKAKYEKGKAWVKAKYEKGKAWVKGKLGLKDKPDERSPEDKEKALRTAVGEATTLGHDPKKTKRQINRELKSIKKKYQLASLELITDSEGKTENRVHVRGTVNPTYDGDGFIISPFPPDKTVIEARIGPPQARAGFEKKVLESPGRAGLPGYERAHLLGAGFGVETPLGLLYAPRFVNQILQNNGIENAIRESYRRRFPGAELSIRAEATAHPGTDLLARVVYTLSGSMPGEPVTEICQFRIIVSANTTAPTWKVQAGEVDPDAVGMFSPVLGEMMASLGDV